MEARLKRSNRETTQLDSREEMCHDRVFDPVARRTVTINPSFRNPKRRADFNAVKFLSEKKSNQEFESIQFLSEDDLQDHLAAIDAFPDKKRLDLLADGALRKIAEYSEIFNKMNNYRLLDVTYEKN